jgi:hypothetical protein
MSRVAESLALAQNIRRSLRERVASGFTPPIFSPNDQRSLSAGACRPYRSGIAAPTIRTFLAVAMASCPHDQSIQRSLPVKINLQRRALAVAPAIRTFKDRFQLRPAIAAVLHIPPQRNPERSEHSKIASRRRRARAIERPNDQWTFPAGWPQRSEHGPSNSRGIAYSAPTEPRTIRTFKLRLRRLNSAPTIRTDRFQVNPLSKLLHSHSSPNDQNIQRSSEHSKIASRWSSQVS